MVRNACQYSCAITSAQLRLRMYTRLYVCCCTYRKPQTALNGNYIFEPIGVETLGHEYDSIRVRSLQRNREKAIQHQGNQNGGIYIAEQISIAIQRGNAASLLGVPPAYYQLSELQRNFSMPHFTCVLYFIIVINLFSVKLDLECTYVFIKNTLFSYLFN